MGRWLLRGGLVAVLGMAMFVPVTFHRGIEKAINASPAQIMQALIDPAKSGKLQPFIEKTRLIQQKGDTVQYEITEQVPIPVPFLGTTFHLESKATVTQDRSQIDDGLLFSDVAAPMGVTLSQHFHAQPNAAGGCIVFDEVVGSAPWWLIPTVAGKFVEAHTQMLANLKQVVETV
eukprot:TRINITY_DN66615_c3_g4_i10.p1 TRINITY_DN66615_c3_g4~~TRINITY_DN66615_c3_g4_i10.p1  ORF type:complete len:175 (-),score=8.01 TRINITY_DN66615_c3_g4_i10:167-691(-)